jgi:hypothetical protein
MTGIVTDAIGMRYTKLATQLQQRWQKIAAIKKLLTLSPVLKSRVTTETIAGSAKKDTAEIWHSSISTTPDITTIFG